MSRRKESATIRRLKTPSPPALVGALLFALPFALSACGIGGPVQTGLPPTHDWPAKMECPNSVTDVCRSKHLTLYGTVNEPNGTVYAVTNGHDVFVICRSEGLAGATCERMEPAGARVVGEAGVYRVDDA